jgi:iron complex transport system permease protein
MKRNTLYCVFFGLLILCCACSIFLGETAWSDVWQGFSQRISGQSTTWNPLLDERLPRLIVILCTGASLATAGAVMQSLFHNPLAAPSILGITSGGSLFVLTIFILNLQNQFPTLIPISAVSGCLLTLIAVYTLARRNGALALNSLILTGIAISSVLIAIQGAIVYAFRDQWQLIQTLTEWEAGSSSDRNWQHVNMQLPLTIVGLLGCCYYRQEINILALGDDEAKNLGVEVDTVRWRLFLCVAMLTGGALAAMGLIAFFGLILPHVIRRLQGPDNRQLIPLCIIAGSGVLALFDITLRFFAINAFSIGNISAIIGGVFFLTLLFGNKKGDTCPQC